MRADYQLRVALPDVATYFTLAIRLKGAGEQDNAVSGLFQNAARRKIMLLRQNLRGSHERDLEPILNGDDRSLEANDRLARTDISLQQTPHGIRLLHVSSDFLKHPLLRGRGMKGQDFLYRSAHALIELESDSGLRFLLPPFQLQSQLDK